METQRPQRSRRRRRVAETDRKRVARACDSCRQQKEKCDGQQPCKRCAKLGRPCFFSMKEIIVREAETQPTTTSPIPRPAPEPQPNPELERVSYLEKIARRYIGNGSLDLESLKRHYESEQGNGDHCESQLEDCGSPHSGPSVIVDETCNILPLENNITHYSGEFSHWNFSQRIKNWIDTSVPKEQSQDSMSSFKDFYRIDELQSPIASAAVLSSLPPRTIANFLLRCFFKHAQTNYFFVEESWLERELDMCYTDAKTQNPSTVCIIFATFAIGTQYAYMESEPGAEREGKRNLGSADPGVSLFSEDAVGVVFYKQAARLLPDVLALSSLQSIQACLLLGLYVLPVDASGLSHSYLSMAINLAVQNGMHRRCEANGLDGRVREIRNRVWWTVFTLERRVTIFHGRPMSIRTADIDADLPQERSDMCPWTIPTVPCLLATLRLNEFLSKIWSEIDLCLCKSASRQQLRDIIQSVAGLHNDLHSWWADVSADLVQPYESPQSPSSRYSLRLRLEYCLVRMFCGRCFIFEAPRTGTTPAVGGRESIMSSDSMADPTHPRAILVTDCIKAAVEAIETCRLIHDTIGLARASYTEFSSCRAALLVITTQCLQTKCHTFRHALRDGLFMLKHMASGSRLAKTEASLIDRFEQVIDRLDQMASIGRAERSDYVKFKTWEVELTADVSTGPSRAHGVASLMMDPFAANVPPRDNEGNASSFMSYGQINDFAFFPEPGLDWSRSVWPDFLSHVDGGNKNDSHEDQHSAIIMGEGK